MPTATAPSSSAGIAVANAPTALAARARRRGSEPTCSGGAVTSAETRRTRGGGCRRGASLNRSRASLARSGSTSTSSGLSTKSGSGRFTESIGSLSSIDIDFLARGRMVDVASDKTRRPSTLALETDRHGRGVSPPGAGLERPEGTAFPRRSRAVSVSTRGAPGDREMPRCTCSPRASRPRPSTSGRSRTSPEARPRHCCQNEGAAGPPDAAPLGIAACTPSANPDPAAQLVSIAYKCGARSPIRVILVLARRRR